MKNTGMTRQLDSLGRVVVPKEVRTTLGISEKDSMEIFLDGENIVFRKYHAPNACMVTGKIADDNISLADGKIVISRDIVYKFYEEIESKFLHEDKG